MLTTLYITQPSAGLEMVKLLFQQYVTELNEDLCFQHWDDELNNPLLKYGPTRGSLLLAFCNNEPAGCVAITALQESGVCEMKRLYVKPAFRKHGIGDHLVSLILEEGKNLGYNKMVLDTLTRLSAAVRLYEKYGFINTSAYYENPLPGVLYMEKNIS